jgi:hypothetical protein
MDVCLTKGLTAGRAPACDQLALLWQIADLGIPKREMW